MCQALFQELGIQWYPSGQKCLPLRDCCSGGLVRTGLKGQTRAPRREASAVLALDNMLFFS